MDTIPKPRRGRPPGSPNKSKAEKPPKVPKPMGRPSVWPAELKPAISRFNHCLPAILDQALDDAEFREKFTGLLLEYVGRQ